MNILVEDDVVIKYAFWVFVSTTMRGVRFLSPLANGIQRCFFYFLAYRSLGGYYVHYSSIWMLEDPARAAKAIKSFLAEVSSKHGGQNR